MSQITTENQTMQAPTQSKAIVPDFGNGRYSNLMLEIYNDSKTVFSLTHEKAEKLAKAIATELGALMASRPVEVKLGKLNKDGRLTISEASKLKGVVLTNNVYCLKALSYAAEAGRNGFSFANTKWTANKSIGEYLASL